MATDNEAGRLRVPGPLVSVEWLAAELWHPELVVLDASWYPPGGGRSGEDEWLRSRIPGARFFDFDGRIRDADSPLPHMLPAASWFTHEARRLGIDDTSAVVVYDGTGVFGSARGWWMLRAMGCANVAVLDGGLPAWRLAELPLEEGDPPRVAPGNFTARPCPERVRSAAEVLAASGDPGARVLDARSAERFHGRVPEPRPGLRRGHIPGSLNLPFDELLCSGHLRPVGELAARFDALAPAGQTLVFSCGSGVSACVLALGAELAGRGHWAVYDGSWAEWGGSDELPVE